MKYSGKWLSKKKASSRWRNLDNSADVTSSGRSFQVRGPTTGKVRLVGDGCQLDRRHWQTASASRTKRLRDIWKRIC